MCVALKDWKCDKWKTNNIATKYRLLLHDAQPYIIVLFNSLYMESLFRRVSQLLLNGCIRLDNEMR